MSRPAFGEGLDEEEETLNKIKTTVKIAGFLLVVLLALGCGGSMPSSRSSLNPHAVATRNAGGTGATGSAGYRIDGLRVGADDRHRNGEGSGDQGARSG